MLIVLIVFVCIILILLFVLLRLKNDPSYITRFLKENPDRSAIHVIRNDEVLIAYNEKKLMPLASTVKIVIALAYAQKVSKGVGRQPYGPGHLF